MLDLSKMVIYPQHLVSQDSIRLAKHKGIDLEIIIFIWFLQQYQIPYCAISFVGRVIACVYIRILIENEITENFPIIFISFNRPQKANLARALKVCLTLDVQAQASDMYRRRGLTMVHIRRGWDLRMHSDEILQGILNQIGVPLVPSQGIGKSAFPHTIRNKDQ